MLQLDGAAYHVDVTNRQIHAPLSTVAESIEGEGKTANTFETEYDFLVA